MVVSNNKLLCVRNASSPDRWCLPGGKVELGEDIESALIREITEETGIVPILGNLLYVHQFKQNNTYGIPEFFYHVINPEDYDNIDLSLSTHGEKELLEIGFVDSNNSNILPIFLKDELMEIITEGFKGPTRVRIMDE